MPEIQSSKGVMRSLLANHDWSSFPPGEMQFWPAQLSYSVSLMLTNKFPMFLIWGSGRHLLYNDAYAVILGGKSQFKNLKATGWS